MQNTKQISLNETLWKSKQKKMKGWCFLLVFLHCFKTGLETQYKQYLGRGEELNNSACSVVPYQRDIFLLLFENRHDHIVRRFTSTYSHDCLSHSQKCTVPCECIHTPSFFSRFMLQPYVNCGELVNFSTSTLHTPYWLSKNRVVTTL